MPNAANPLLDDIDADYHQFLLERGNLVPRPREVSWSDENRWTSLGYSARTLRTVCACGSHSDTMLGIFHDERTPSGKTRSLALDPARFQIPLDGNFPVYRTTGTCAVCPSCLSSKGFSSEITNV
jgi:hypothetical protein